MKLKLIAAVLFLFIFVSYAEAGQKKCNYCTDCQCAQGTCPTGCPSTGTYVQFNNRIWFVPAGYSLVHNGQVVFRSGSCATGCADGKCPLEQPKASTTAMPKLKN